jgi:hypothetical protein
LFSIWLCFFLSSHHHCCYQCSLHHICVNWISNDDIHQNLEVVSKNKDIHFSSDVAKEKVGDLLLNMCSTFQKNRCENILKYMIGCCTFILAKPPK